MVSSDKDDLSHGEYKVPKILSIGVLFELNCHMVI